MKAITLHTPLPDNGGARRDAGETITLGDAADEITVEMAHVLIAAGSAIEADSSPAAALPEAASPGNRKAKVLPDTAADEAE